MALEVGIVGPSGSGKTSLFTALTKAGGGEYGKTNVGMAPIADERLGRLAEVVKARKVTPATVRVQDVPGSAQFGALRRGQHFTGRQAGPPWQRLLPLQCAQFWLDLVATHLGVADGGLDRWRAAGGDMAQIVGQFFETPAGRSRTMGKIMA